MSASAVRRDPREWVEDMGWHRRMFDQSYFRWMPEDPMSLALTWTKGRVLYETPRHLRFLDEQFVALRTYAAGIEHAMVPFLDDAQERCSKDAWRSGLELVGLTSDDVSLLRFYAPAQQAPHKEVRRALRGWPLQNPFSRIWELRQMRAMYAAAENLLEDTFCDLAVELAPKHGWQNLSQVTLYNNFASGLQQRVDWQREERGEPGDPRRRPAQSYPAL
ncbi:hypothetical protein [Xylanimonas cellulosilytica]|nr:hypothetical protein [Xylanimonas cellulosilytica]